MKEELIKIILEQINDSEYDTIGEAISGMKESVEYITEDDIIEYIIDNDIEVNSNLKLKVLEYKAGRSLHLDDFKEIIENNEEIKNEIKKSFELIQNRYNENVTREVTEDEPLFSITDEFETIIELLEQASNTNFDDFTDIEGILWDMGEDNGAYTSLDNEDEVAFAILNYTVNDPIMHKMQVGYNGISIFKNDVW